MNRANPKLSTLVDLGDVTPNRATVTAVGDGPVIVYHCPEHGRAPQVGDRIWVDDVGHRPRCCPHLPESP